MGVIKGWDPSSRGARALWSLSATPVPRPTSSRRVHRGPRGPEAACGRGTVTTAAGESALNYPQIHTQASQRVRQGGTRRFLMAMGRALARGILLLTALLAACPSGRRWRVAC